MELKMAIRSKVSQDGRGGQTGGVRRWFEEQVEPIAWVGGVM